MNFSEKLEEKVELKSFIKYLKNEKIEIVDSIRKSTPGKIFAQTVTQDPTLEKMEEAIQWAKSRLNALG